MTLVVRLNKKYYDERRFTRAGIKHVDMYYLDGSVPPEQILQHFLKRVCAAVHAPLKNSPHPVARCCC